ncbi:Transposon TX1 uncharacterized 149 kDa protein [Linum perenne]
MALFYMHPDKASSPDGFNPGFYQKMWDVIGTDVVAASKNWLAAKSFSLKIRETTIVLLPKVTTPQSMKDLRPISLCNVLYRLVAKVLANRLKRVMPSCVGAEQSTFLKGRSISDNVLIDFETLHAVKIKQRTKQDLAVLKIDISKAFDRVKWGNLGSILRRLGFSQTRIGWMLMCVGLTNYRVLMNGEFREIVKPGRELRQRCPLSPFLFNLCAEGLAAMLNSEVRKGRIQGTHVSSHAPHITHLFFADDCIFFFRAGTQDARAIRRIIDTYAAASGQLINYKKSGIFFSRETDMLCYRMLSALLLVSTTLLILVDTWAYRR